MPSRLSVFRSPEGEAEYLAFYDSALARWPGSYEDLSLPTRFGQAHVIACGPKEAPPVLLLHGQGLGAVSWARFSPALCECFRVYAPDIINDLGKTAMTRMVQSRGDFTAWLTDLLDGLKITQIAIVGHSFGGWLAMAMAQTAPKRVTKLVTVSPAASFSPYPLIFLYRSISMGLRPTQERAEHFVRWMLADGFEPDREQMEMLVTGLRNYHPPRLVLATVFTDEELRSIHIPTLLLVGEREVIYSPQKTIERAKKYIPNIHAEIIPEAGHGSVIEKPQELSTRVLKFLQD